MSSAAQISPGGSASEQHTDQKEGDVHRNDASQPFAPVLSSHLSVRKDGNPNGSAQAQESAGTSQSGGADPNSANTTGPTEKTAASRRGQSPSSNGTQALAPDAQQNSGTRQGKGANTAEQTSHTVRLQGLTQSDTQRISSHKQSGGREARRGSERTMQATANTSSDRTTGHGTVKLEGVLRKQADARKTAPPSSQFHQDTPEKQSNAKNLSSNTISQANQGRENGHSRHQSFPSPSPASREASGGSQNQKPLPPSLSHRNEGGSGGTPSTESASGNSGRDAGTQSGNGSGSDPHSQQNSSAKKFRLPQGDVQVNQSFGNDGTVPSFEGLTEDLTSEKASAAGTSTGTPGTASTSGVSDVSSAKPSAQLRPQRGLAAQAWLQNIIRNSASGYSKKNGWHVLTMDLNDQNGSMTVKAQKQEDRVAVNVGLTDNRLKALLAASTDRLQSILQADYDSLVDLSLTTQQDSSSGQDPDASHGSSGSRLRAATDSEMGPAQTQTANAGIGLEGTHIWIG